MRDRPRPPTPTTHQQQRRLFPQRFMNGKNKNWHKGGVNIPQPHKNHVDNSQPRRIDNLRYFKRIRYDVFLLRDVVEGHGPRFGTLDRRVGEYNRAADDVDSRVGRGGLAVVGGGGNVDGVIFVMRFRQVVVFLEIVSVSVALFIGI